MQQCTVNLVSCGVPNNTDRHESLDETVEIGNLPAIIPHTLPDDRHNFASLSDPTAFV